MIFHPRKWLEPHLLDALDSMRFELLSIKGRWLNPRRLNTQGRDYLQLGCWETLIAGFLNTDFFINKHADAHLDARFPLPFDDKTWRGVYAHHVVEHVCWPDAFRLFRECHRVLKRSGVFRMVVPNLEVFLRRCCSSDPDERRTIRDLYPAHIMESLDARTPLEVVDYIFRDHKFNRHLSAWDWETAECRLLEAGFSKVIRRSVNQSLDPNMAGHDNIRWEDCSLYVEAVK